MNCNVQIDAQGPKEIKGERPDKKYFNFLSRNYENYDKIKKYFNDNYNNDSYAEKVESDLLKYLMILTP